MTTETTAYWQRDGRTVYALNDQGTNHWSATVQSSGVPDAEIDKIVRLIAAAPALMAAVMTTEWIAGGRDEEHRPLWHCPSCWASREEGHRVACIIAYALRLLREE